MLIVEEAPEKTVDDTCAEQFDQIVRARRSIRVFTAEPVPEAVIEACLEWGLLAPNSSNLQPWHFYWVRDKALHGQIAEACLGQQAATTASDLIVAVARTRTWRAMARRTLAEWPGGNPPKIVRDYYGKIAPFMYTQGPLGILGLLKRAVLWSAGWFRPVPRWPVSPGHMREWAIKTTALACENIMLGLSAHGYDSCPMEGIDEKRIKKALKLPKDSVVVMVIGAGRGAPEGLYGPRLRVPRHEVVTRM